MSQLTIFCGACKGPAKSVSNPKPDDTVSCSRCGREDRFDNVMRSVQDYVTDSLAKSLNASMAKAVRNSKFVKVTTKSVPQRSYRWVSTEVGV